MKALRSERAERFAEHESREPAGTRLQTGGLGSADERGIGERPDRAGNATGTKEPKELYRCTWTTWPPSVGMPSTMTR
ncbi:MAG: hypothetical protein NVS3B16_06510 [Vulcanimicrobiaceae bacterium]